MRDNAINTREGSERVLMLGCNEAEEESVLSSVPASQPAAALPSPSSASFSAAVVVVVGTAAASEKKL